MLVDLEGICLDHIMKINVSGTGGNQQTNAKFTSYLQSICGRDHCDAFGIVVDIASCPLVISWCHQ